MMKTVYQLNADELNTGFLESVKVLFLHKNIEVIIHELDEKTPSTTQDVKDSNIFSIPTNLTLDSDVIGDNKPTYQSIVVDEIIMPSRDERYER